MAEAGIPVIQGDATEEETLVVAGIERANGLLAYLSTDMENIMVVLTARGLNQKLYIISRAINPGSPEKLAKVGADKTVSINENGGKRMAGMIMRPHIISFLYVITRVGQVELDLEEVEVHAGSAIDGKRLREAEIPQKTGLIVLAINQGSKQNLIFNPSGEQLISSGDILIVMGRQEQVDSLIALVR